MKPIRFHPAARAEMKVSLLWYSEQSDSAALGFSAELRGAYSAIRSDPQLYPTYLHGTQRILLKRYPFSVVYRELLDSITVLAVAHAKRRPGYWKSRL